MDVRHVPDLEHCQEFDRLCKEKNITIPETEFYWKVGKASGHANLTTDKPDLENWTKTDDGFDWYHAPLVSEQGEWLGKVSGKDFLNSYLEVMDLFIFQIDKMQMSHNLMTDPDIGISMINYLIAEGIITTL